MYPQWLRDRIQPIRLIVLDVDGVLTDGRVRLQGAREEAKAFHVLDGGTIRLAQRAGLELALLTGRSSEVVARRADELGVERVVQGAHRKGPALEELMNAAGAAPEETAFMGDGWIDLPAFRRVGLCLAPSDAPALVRRRAHWVTRLPGGAGAVGEALELILRIKEQWAEQFDRYERD